MTGYNTPWRRKYYHRKLRAHWEKETDYCEGVRNQSQYKHGRTLLDLMDMALLDFLIGEWLAGCN